MLKKVTITGADDKIKQQDLLSIALKYPFVEFGILISTKTGRSRYPQISWILDLDSIKEKTNFSLHLCGDILSNFINGIKLEDLIGKNVFSIFNRFQLNFSNKFDKINLKNFSYNIKNNPDKEFIFQTRSFSEPLIDEVKDLNNVKFLYDCSGGRGILPTEWIGSDVYCGYAGGLTPENLEFNLSKISDVCTADFWIDAETGLRTNDEFDLNKVVDFLQIASKFIKKENINECK